MPSTSRIDIRLTEKEKQQVEQAAKSYGMSLSEYVRLVCLNAKIEVKIKDS